MSDILEGDEWKHAKPDRHTESMLKPRSRAEQQAWMDDQYGKGKITVDQWRFQFDLLSLENTDGSFPDIK